MRTAVVLAACLAVAACGGGNRTERGVAASQVRIASGLISDACMRSGRKGATRELCGCVQGVADQSLSGADQRLAVTFFSDPHQAQVIRQSDNPRHEDFWKRYRAFADRAEQLCRGV